MTIDNVRLRHNRRGLRALEESARTGGAHVVVVFGGSDSARPRFRAALRIHHEHQPKPLFSSSPQLRSRPAQKAERLQHRHRAGNRDPAREQGQRWRAAIVGGKRSGAGEAGGDSLAGPPRAAANGSAGKRRTNVDTDAG